MFVSFYHQNLDRKNWKCPDDVLLSVPLTDLEAFLWERIWYTGVLIKRRLLMFNCIEILNLLGKFQITSIEYCFSVILGVGTFTEPNYFDFLHPKPSRQECQMIVYLAFSLRYILRMPHRNFSNHDQAVFFVSINWEKRAIGGLKDSWRPFFFLIW